jgi:multidrug efflux pump subunit AcrB
MNLFMSSLAEAVLIVLAVSFLSLGCAPAPSSRCRSRWCWRSPSCLMNAFGIDLQRISLGALVIALGLLVDDAIIAVEMMVVKMEQGWDRFKAATFAYTSTAFPMLTGTLITAASASCRSVSPSRAPANTPFSIFSGGQHRPAGVVAGRRGVHPLSGLQAARSDQAARKAARSTAATSTARPSIAASAPSNGALRHRWLVIAATVLAFAASLVGLQHGRAEAVLPGASRPEMLVDLWLPNGASLKATEAQAKKSSAARRAGDEPSLDQVPSRAISATAARVSTCRSTSNCSTTTSRSSSSRRRTSRRARISSAASKAALRRRRRFLERPANARAAPRKRSAGRFSGASSAFSGEDLASPARQRRRRRRVMRAIPHLKDVNFDWNEMGKAIRVEIDQDRARALGASARTLSAFLRAMLTVSP